MASSLVSALCFSSATSRVRSMYASLHISCSPASSFRLFSARSILAIHKSTNRCGSVHRRSACRFIANCSRSLQIRRTYGSISSVLKAQPPYFISLTPKKSAWLCFASGPQTTANYRDGQERQQPTLYMWCYIPSTSLHFRSCLRSKGRIAPYFFSKIL